MKADYTNFSRLFNKVKSCKEMDPSEKLILTEIISHALDNKRYNYTNPQIANWLGLSQGNVKTKLSKLRKKGFIHSECKNIQPPNGGKYFKQRTLTVVDIRRWIDYKAGRVHDLDENKQKLFFERYMAKNGNEYKTLGEEQFFRKIESLTAAEVRSYLY